MIPEEAQKDQPKDHPTADHHPPSTDPHPATPPWVDPLTQNVSVFQDHRDTTPAYSVPLREMLRSIGVGKYRHWVEKLRGIFAAGDLARYREEKDQSPAFTPCAQLRSRAADDKVPWEEQFVAATGIVHHDFDHVADIPRFKKTLAADPSCVFAFTSPSGDGLKTGYAVAGITDRATYVQAWHLVSQRLRGLFPDASLTEDAHVKNIKSLCYVSWDKALYVNPNAVPLVLPVTPPDEEAPMPEPTTGADDLPNQATIASALFAISGYDSYDTWIAVGQSLHSTQQPWARGLWDAWSAQSPKFAPDAQGKKWRTFSANGKRHVGEILTLAHQAGWRPATWGQAYANGTAPEGFTTHYHAHLLRGKSEPFRGLDTGQESTEGIYHANHAGNAIPWPVMQPEAFYGLAGDYVRAIAPESESDPVALLAQFLAVFGVAAGRHAYCQVEATRHYPNIFEVIAGRTSRARKGTSFGHVDTQIRTADHSWSQNNHVKGLGSGEGLISAVRDARIVREPLKEKGVIVGYQDVEQDEGVSDKRAWP
jgi:hypothetical protein